MNQRLHLEAWEETDSNRDRVTTVASSTAVLSFPQAHREDNIVSPTTAAHDKVCVLVKGNITVSF